MLYFLRAVYIRILNDWNFFRVSLFIIKTLILLLSLFFFVLLFQILNSPDKEDEVFGKK